MPTFAAKTLSDKVEHYLDVIARDNPKMNIFLHVNDDAVDQAELIEEKMQQGTAGRLAGKVIAVKSCICVQDMITTCGSKTLEHWKATYDADVIRYIKQEDGIIIGMVNMDEFACGALGNRSAFGKVMNPQAPDRVPGGSSSGSAAAVAAGMCDMALGSDTGGSVRAPASHCGVVGIKPSYGRVSRYGLIDMTMSFDQIGVVARNVQDAKLLLSVIAQTSDNDGSMRDEAMPENYNGELRVGMSDSLFSLCGDHRICSLIQQKVSDFEQTHSTQHVSVDVPYVDLSVQTYYPIVYTEFFSGTRKFDGRRFALKIEESAGPEVLRRIEGGKFITQAEHDGKFYKKALVTKKRIAQAIDAAFDNCDVMILPVAPVLPPKQDEEVSTQDDYMMDKLTCPANLAGICGGVVPIGEIDGVPVGVQLWCRAGREDILVEAMKRFEEL